MEGIHKHCASLYNGLDHKFSSNEESRNCPPMSMEGMGYIFSEIGLAPRTKQEK